jgi:hypothetical protein
MGGPLVTTPAAEQLRDSALYAEAAISVRLCAALDGVAAQLQQRHDWLEKLAGAYWEVSPDPIPLGSMPALRVNAGPTTGYWWAVQRITIGPIGATTDLIHVYKSRVSAEQQPQTALTTLTGAASAAGAFLTWTPGRAGCLLHSEEKIGLSGTITGTNPVMSWDVVQGETWALPFYI